MVVKGAEVPLASLFLPDYGGNVGLELLVRVPRTLSLFFQGDRRDEEEETQMKKSESEVEVRAGGQGR